MRAIALGCALIGACVAMPGHAKEDVGKFRADMVQRLRVILPKATIEPVPNDPLVVKLSGEGLPEVNQINLDSVFVYCQNVSRMDCETRKAEFVVKITKKQPGPSLTSLRVIVRNQAYVDYMLSLKDKDGQPVAYPVRRIGDDLHELMAFDTPDTIMVAPLAELAGLGVDEDTAWTLAERQTAHRLPGLPTAEQLAKTAVTFQDKEYQASLLVRLPEWSKLAENVGPDMFVTAVSDQFVFVGVMPDGARLDDFRKAVVDDCAHQQRCVSPNIYRFHDGGWRIAGSPKP